MSELVKLKLGVEDTHNAYDAINDRYTFVISGRWFVNFRGQKYIDFFRAGDTLSWGIIEAHLIEKRESGYTLTKDGFNEPLKRKGAGVSNFKNIKKLGLSITTWGGDPRTSAVLAQELESLLQSAQVVYGTKYKNTPDESEWATHQLSQDTHSALLIGITPLKKKTKAEAALEFIQRVADREYTSWSRGSVADEAKRILEMKDEE